MATRRPAEVFPPGEFLREELEARGWTEAHLANLLACSPEIVGQIIAGKRAISPDTADALAKAFGTSPELWLSLDAAYQRARVGANTDGQRAEADAPAPRRPVR